MRGEEGDDIDRGAEEKEGMYNQLDVGQVSCDSPFHRVFERGEAKVVIDELSLSFLAGSTVDYHRELIRSSFRITDNPNAELGCSCGASFALK